MCKLSVFNLIRELIDTCWDVNLMCCYCQVRARLELIDTCWDVNTRFIVSNPYLNIELIDTCWAVNSLRLFASIYRGLRINKYILKYKYQKIEYKL